MSFINFVFQIFSIWPLQCASMNVQVCHRVLVPRNSFCFVPVAMADVAALISFQMERYVLAIAIGDGEVG